MTNEKRYPVRLLPPELDEEGLVVLGVRRGEEALLPRDPHVDRAGHDHVVVPDHGRVAGERLAESGIEGAAWRVCCFVVP